MKIRFTRDFSEDNDDLISSAFYRGSYRYWRHSIVGRILVEDRELGAVTVVNLGEINRGSALRSRVLDQNFRTIGSTERNQNGGLQCGKNSCDVVVLRLSAETALTWFPVVVAPPLTSWRQSLFCSNCTRACHLACRLLAFFSLYKNGA